MRHARFSISMRLAVLTTVVGLLMSGALSAWQLRTAYREEVAATAQMLDEVGRSALPSLATSLWRVDEEHTRLQLQALALQPRISYLQLRSERTPIELGDAAAEPLLRRSYDLRHEEAGRDFPLGTLEIVAGDGRLQAQVRRAALSIGTVTSVTVFGTAALLLLVFRQWVTRHLEAMAAYARKMDLEHLKTPLRLNRHEPDAPDELGRVANAVNAMRERMLAALEIRDRDEAELRAYRDRLEQLVQARTRQLQEQAQHMKQLANTDDLTGVGSRRYFEEIAQRELVRARRTGQPLALLVLDIDHFKRINDSHGHAIGDRVLEGIATQVQRALREIDMVGRTGGEEFAIILPGTTMPQALQVAERVRASAERLQVEGPDGDAIRVTASIGAALLLPEQSLAELMAAADAAMYRAKHGGRNRVCQAGTTAAGNGGTLA